MHKNIFIAALFLMLLCGGAVSVAYAADSYTVATGATVVINEHGVCQRVYNGSTSRMVPTKSAAEWTSFRSSPGAGISLSACAKTCGPLASNYYCSTGSAIATNTGATGSITQAQCATWCQGYPTADGCDWQNAVMAGTVTCTAYTTCGLAYLDMGGLVWGGSCL